MSATRDKNARDYKKLAAQQVKMSGPSLGNAELHYLSTLPDSELMKIPRVADIQGALSDVSAKYEVVQRESWLAEGFDRQYAEFIKAAQHVNLGVRMMSKQIVNKAVNAGGGIMGAGKLINRRESISLAAQVAIVLLGLLTLAVFISIVENVPFGAAMSASPYGLPNVVWLIGVFLIVTLWLRNRSRPKQG